MVEYTIDIQYLMWLLKFGFIHLDNY